MGCIAELGVLVVIAVNEMVFDIRLFEADVISLCLDAISDMCTNKWIRQVDKDSSTNSWARPMSMPRANHIVV